MQREERIFSLPWPELKKLQEERLRDFVTRQLYPFSTYYRTLFDSHKINPHSIRTVADLKAIPFTSKTNFLPGSNEDQTQRNLSFLLKPDTELIRKYAPTPMKLALLATKLLRGESYLKEKLESEYYPIFLTATTGTTQQPISFLYTPYDLDNLKLYGKRLLNIFGTEKGEKVVNLFPYAPHLAFWQVFFGGIATNTFIVSTGGGKTVGTEGNLKSIAKVRPEYLMGVPSYIYHLLQTARDKKMEFPFVKKVVLGAGRVPVGFKMKVADLLQEMGAKNIQVFGTYGFTEARTAWGECPSSLRESSGYHTYPDQEIFEIVDPETGEVKGEGEDGEIVYSNLNARGTCVFRYRTGDLARGGITYAPCPYCGRTTPRISSNICRASNLKTIQMTKIKGTLVDLNMLELLLDDAREIFEWQIEIRKKNDDPFDIDILELYLSLNDGVDKEAFLKRLNARMLGDVEVSFNGIHVVSETEIKNRIGIESAVKALKIVDKRPKD